MGGKTKQIYSKKNVVRYYSNKKITKVFRLKTSGYKINGCKIDQCTVKTGL